MKTESNIQAPPSGNRAGIRRTAWILAACAVGSYVVFLLSVLGAK